MKAYYHDIDPIWKEYTLGDFLGSGSYGNVWEFISVENPGCAKEALKEVRVPPVSAGGMDEAYLQGLDEAGALYYYQGMKKRALDEIKLMKQLSYCKEIVGFKEYGICTLEQNENDFGWVIFIRMELLLPFKKKLKNQGISIMELCCLGIDLCNALIVLKKEEILHKDIKPENLFYDPDGKKFKLGDFGISYYVSRETEMKGLPGTLTYMSPEVYQGKAFSYASDLYAVGMILYKLLNDNRIPFLPLYPIAYTPAMRNQAMYRRLQGEGIEPASIVYSDECVRHPTLIVTKDTLTLAKELEKISRKAINANPADRYTSPEDLKMDIQKLLKGTTR